MTVHTLEKQIKNYCLCNLFIEDLAHIFISRIQNLETRKRYKSCLNRIFISKVLNPRIVFQEIFHINASQCLDDIFIKVKGSRSTQQTCAAAFISFFKFLNRISKGKISIPITQKFGVFKTFIRIRNKTIFPSLSREEVKKVINFSYKQSIRLGIFVEMSLQSTKRIGEILNSKIEDINWKNSYIVFKVSKVEGEKESIITFPNHFFLNLQKLIGEKISGFIFQTKSGKKVQKDYIWRQLVSVAKKASIEKKLTPHTLRATSITLYRSFGFSLDEMIDITGHSSIEMVRYYDKSDLIKNPSNKISLI